MIETYFGEIIRKNRIAQGLSQQKLCDGICDPATLSRIENGVNMPSRNRAITLLQRLGLSADRYYSMTSKYDAEIDMLEFEIRSCSVWYEGSCGEEKSRAKKQGLDTIQQLEKIARKDDPITRQLILHAKVTFGGYSLSEQLSMLTDAIRLTIPQFNIDDVNRYLYSLEEIKLITLISVRHSKMGAPEKSVHILEQLLSYVQAHNQNMNQSAGHLPFVAYHYALELGKIKQYCDAIEVAEIGKNACIKYGNYHLLPGFLHISAECQHFLSNDADSKRLYTQAYYLYQVLNNERDIKTLRDEMQRYLNLTLDS